MRTTIFKWVILCLLLAYVTFTSIWARQEADARRCRGIGVAIEAGTALDSVARHGVMSHIGSISSTLRGKKLNDINTKKMEDALTCLPMFESVECGITPSDSVIIHVVPMIPEIRVFEDSVSYYINKDGKQVDAEAEYFADVPVVIGHFDSIFPASSILPLTRFIEGDEAMRNLVAMIKVRDADNIFLVPRIRGHVINFGNVSDLQSKRDAIMAFYRKVMPFKGWDAYDTISVRFRGQVVATRRDKNRRIHGFDFEDDIDPEEHTLPEGDDMPG